MNHNLNTKMFFYTFIYQDMNKAQHSNINIKANGI